jgi:hypothetical protein
MVGPGREGRQRGADGRDDGMRAVGGSSADHAYGGVEGHRPPLSPWPSLGALLQITKSRLVAMAAEMPHTKSLIMSASGAIVAGGGGHRSSTVARKSSPSSVGADCGALHVG